MAKYQPPLPRGLLDSIEAARYSFNRVAEHAKNAMNELLNAQSSFSEKLNTSAEEIFASKTAYINAFHARGPAQRGISHTEAFDRQMLFRNEYDQLLRRAESVQRGQALFGLPIMDISDLKSVGRQLDLLQRLYGLYSDVYKLAGSFEDQMWRDANIDDIETSLLALQTRYALYFSFQT
ncbi:unnamed protein product [Schistocephalus solidus]|uniref:LXG domain-containing protein n=1 Tax=Schistocephalus solidus TaxID=70667 RepID=A0A183SBF7_SCHSO|nr:unnamed protein product [Schistocephalus solidus]